MEEMKLVKVNGLLQKNVITIRYRDPTSLTFEMFRTSVVEYI